VGTRAGLDAVEKRKIPSPPPAGIEPPNPDCLSRSSVAIPTELPRLLIPVRCFNYFVIYKIPSFNRSISANWKKFGITGLDIKIHCTSYNNLIG
jgi:hypothetical protein